MVAEREHAGDPPEDGIAVAADNLGEWERQSDPLTVSAAYRDRFETFATHFESEMAAVGDDSLQQELDVLHALATHGTTSRLVPATD
ncbi:hypothetical protein [Haloarchaeobius sp. DFWS5]|uniref:hypothetical protein n=1 Tax=Haloarchaeobius sp. DFWS5 TaxID=3446114 RepID=UPI003EBBC0A6